MSRNCYQINLQQGFGGGEIYTVFLIRALQSLGVRCHLFVSRRADWWQRQLPPEVDLIPVDGASDIASLLPRQKSWVLTHGTLVPSAAKAIAAAHFLTGIAHMPLYGRGAFGFEQHRRVYGVSAYVRDSLRDFLEPTQVYPEPLYGVAQLDGRVLAKGKVRRRSRYDWDRRKGRDRLLRWLEPPVEFLRAHPVYQRQPGINLGIVSRLTPIKQFPLLFKFLVPQLLRHPQFNLEIFGAGGYASVRDLSRALSPLGRRVRYWGHQPDVAAVYGQLDYLLTGLPEKEALGLNVIEAQAMGLSVLAVHAAPFTETVLDGLTGYFYRDPRQDNAADFGRLLEEIEAAPIPKVLDARQQEAVTLHLNRFSTAAFRARLEPLLVDVMRCMDLPA